jgi:predicted enzyme related to lactoylglutathione lyase
MSPVTPGSFIWHELLTPDPDAAIGFYENVVGWGVMPWQQDPNYRMFVWNGVPMAGVMRLTEEVPSGGGGPAWLSYVSVADVDATLVRIEALGGRTHAGPMDVPTVGRIAVVADPQGAVLGIYRPDMDGPEGDALVLGDFSWHELVANDWKAAWDFYRAVFGWEFASQFDMGEWGMYWMFRRPGSSRTLGGMYNRPPSSPAPHWLPYVHVTSADRAAELAGQRGGRVVHGPSDVPGGDRIAQIFDPQGAAFAVHAVAAAPAVKPKPTTSPAAKPVAAKPPAKAPAAKRTPAKREPAKMPRAAKAARSAGRPVKKTSVKKAVAPQGRPVKKLAAKKPAKSTGRPVKKTPGRG